MSTEKIAADGLGDAEGLSFEEGGTEAGGEGSGGELEGESVCGLELALGWAAWHPPATTIASSARTATEIASFG